MENKEQKIKMLVTDIGNETKCAESINDSINTEMIAYNYKKGFRFKPSWDCKIEFFEFVSYDGNSDMIHLKAYPKEDEPYDTEISFLEYEAAFFNDDYLPL